MNYCAYICCFVLAILVSCKMEKEPESELETRLKRLESELDSLKKTKTENIKGPVAEPKMESRTEFPVEKQTTRPTKKTEKPEKENPKPHIHDPNKDTTFHYYVNGKISVKIHPWKDQERKIELFDLYGKVTYTCGDIWKSYTTMHRLSFHSNGAVKKMEVSHNPGASMYFYTDHIQFSTTNDPEVMYKEKFPTNTIQDAMEAQIPWFYNKKSKTWVKQEVME